MSSDNDMKLVEYLYDEMSDEEAENFERVLDDDPALDAEFNGVSEALSLLREEDDEPPAHLDSLIMAEARKVAESTPAAGIGGWWTKIKSEWFGSSMGLVAAGAAAVLTAAVFLPTLLKQQSLSPEESPAALTIPKEDPPAPPAEANDEAGGAMNEREGDEKLDDLAAAVDKIPESQSDALKAADAVTKDEGRFGAKDIAQPAKRELQKRPAPKPYKERTRGRRSKKAKSKAAKKTDRLDDGFNKGLGDITSGRGGTRGGMLGGDTLGSDGSPAPGRTNRDTATRKLSEDREKDAKENEALLGAAEGPTVRDEGGLDVTSTPAPVPTAPTAPAPSRAPASAAAPGAMQSPTDSPPASIDLSISDESVSADDSDSAYEEEISVAKSSRSSRRARRAAAKKKKPAEPTLAQRQAIGQQALANATAAFKRGNRKAGRLFLERGFAAVGRAPVQAELSFRLAELNLMEARYDDAIRFARIAASAAKFDKRTEALRIMEEAQAKQAKPPKMDRMMEMAPASEPNTKSY